VRRELWPYHWSVSFCRGCFAAINRSRAKAECHDDVVQDRRDAPIAMKMALDLL